MAQEEADEVAALDRVLTRLAMTNDDKRLETVLDKLLPRLLERLGESDAIRNKTLQVLSHINKRVKDNDGIKLPCFPLAEMMRPQAGSSAFAVNFSLVYLELGSDRLSPGEKSRLVPLLFAGIGSLPEMQVVIVLRILASVLPFVSVAGDMTKFFQEGTSEKDKAFVLSYFLDWLLYIPPSSSSASVGSGVPPGLTPGRVARLKRKDGSLPDGAQLAELQAAVLKILLAGAFSNEQVLSHLIVGRSALRHDVVTAAEHGMARVMKKVNLADPELLLRLISLADSTQAGGLRAAGEGARKPCSHAVRERALAVLMKADPAGLAQVTQECIEMVEHCMLGSNSSQDLRVLALQFCQKLLRAVSARVTDSEEGEEVVWPAKLALGLRRQFEQLRQHQGSSATLKEREETYSCIGLLAHHFPNLYADNVLLVQELLRLVQVQVDARMSLQEALGSLCNAFCEPHGSENARKTVKRLILPYIDSQEPKARLVAAEWCRRICPFNDPEARFVCVSLSADPDMTVRNEAIRGLLPELCSGGGGSAAADQATTSKQTASQQASQKRISESAQQQIEKRVARLIEVLCDATKPGAAGLALAWVSSEQQPEENAVLVRGSSASRFPDFAVWLGCLMEHAKDLIEPSSATKESQEKLASLIGFTGATLTQNVHRPHIAASRQFHQLVETCLGLKDLTQTRVLHSVASKCLVQLVELGRSSSPPAFPVMQDWLLEWLESDSAVVRENVASLVPSCDQASSAAFIEALLQRMKRKVLSGVHSRHGAILAAGCMLGDVSTAKVLQEQDKESLCSALASILHERSKFRVIAVACIDALGLAAASNALQLTSQQLEQVVERLESISKFDTASSSGSVELDASNLSILNACLRALGKFCLSTSFDENLRSKVVGSLFAAGDQKQAELQLVVGEALSGLAAKSEQDLRFVIRKLLTETCVSSKNRVRAASAFWLLRVVRDHGRSPSCQEFLEPCHAAFATLLRERSELTRECAARGMAWTFQSATDASVKNELVTSLARHLAVKSVYLSELKRDYEKAKERKAKETGSIEDAARLAALVRNDNDGEGDEGEAENSSQTPGAGGEASTQTGPKSAEVGGLAKNTATAPLHLVYKEVFQIATRVNMPALTYRLLYLSAGDPIWQTSALRGLRCSAYSLDPADDLDSQGGNGDGNDDDDDDDGEKGTGKPRLWADDLTPEVEKELVPALFRFKYDLDKPVQSTMLKLWTTITLDMGSDSDILKANLDRILPELLRNIASSKFRERHGGAVGLATVIREIPDEKTIIYLQEIWKLSLRLLDDLNDATKLAAAVLAKEVMNVTVRLCTMDEDGATQTPEKLERSREALAIALPFLLEKGVLEQSKEGQAVAMLTLARVVKVSKEHIRDQGTKVITRLLETMSEMEDAKLQYAMFHTSDQGGSIGISREELESRRVQAFNDSPMQQAVDICVDQIRPEDPLEELGPELARLARVSVGLPSMMATSRTIARVVSRRDLAKGVGAHAEALLKGLASSLNDRSRLVRTSFASTAASVAALAPPPAVKSYVKVLTRLYSDPGDDKSRLTVANALRELLQRSPDLFKTLEEQLLPLLFLARHDDDEEIAEVFRDVFRENAGTIQHGVSKSLHLLVPFCIQELETTTKWMRKKQAVESLREVMNAVQPDKSRGYAPDVLASLAAALPGRLWAGKQVLLKAICDVWKRCRGFSGTMPAPFDSLQSLVAKVLAPEACRSSASAPYVSAAFDAIAGVCLIVEDGVNDDANQLVEAVFLALEKYLPTESKETGTSSEADVDDSSTSKNDSGNDLTRDDSIIAKAFEALGATWRAATCFTLFDQLLHASKSALKGSSHIVAVGVMTCFKRVYASIVVTTRDHAALLKQGMDMAWRCIIENKHPSPIKASLQAMQSFFSRTEIAGSQCECTDELRLIAESCQTRLKPLMNHRESTVVLAASQLKKSAAQFLERTS